MYSCTFLEAVGAQTTLLHYNGANWTAQSVIATVDLESGLLAKQPRGG
jgi:hypothetical protein